MMVRMIFLVIALALCLSLVSSAAPGGDEKLPPPLKVEVATNSIDIEKAPQVVGQDLEIDTEYTVTVVSSVMIGNRLLPVIVMRGDAKAAVAWECLYNGNIRTFNSASIPKIAFFFAGRGVEGATGSAYVTIRKGNAEVAALSLDGQKNSIDLDSAPCVTSQALSARVAYNINVVSTAAIAGVPMPVLLVWDEGEWTRYDFLRGGGGTAMSGDPPSSVKAIFIRVGSQPASGSAEVRFSLPSVDD